MPDEIALSAADAATEAARADILAAINLTGPGAVGHGAIRLRVQPDPPPVAVAAATGEPAAPALERAGHGRVRLRR